MLFSLFGLVLALISGSVMSCYFLTENVFFQQNMTPVYVVSASNQKLPPEPFCPNFLGFSWANAGPAIRFISPSPILGCPLWQQRGYRRLYLETEPIAGHHRFDCVRGNNIFPRLSFLSR
ncbi:hypothetical protein RHD99_13595 [Buttiauxella selenatireducens]|uniref:Secreted protein n=1 Tax=Buttiauxella selenatireducens TaxID=3073902 RepID=A0ABY9S5A7_9ENTR|nr:hypothetical protein [Buttiauxella sp. R73]WMY72519.1 hypothetical protein RHD99_13595 [Buttiauxella sp. R73]